MKQDFSESFPLLPVKPHFTTPPFKYIYIYIYICTHSYTYIYRRAIRKVTSGEMLTKQAMRKTFLLYTKKCILKILLNVVTAGTEALVSCNKFLYAPVKEVCRL
jgi:hypothetical protein